MFGVQYHVVSSYTAKQNQSKQPLGSPVRYQVPWLGLTETSANNYLACMGFSEAFVGVLLHCLDRHLRMEQHIYYTEVATERCTNASVS
jgi:hypothetical protein